MPNRLKTKKVALVTGGAKRIGRAICLSLAAKGYTIALHYNRSKAEAEKVSKLIRAKRGTCKLFHCDLADKNQTAELISSVKKTCGRLDVLINSASVFKTSSIKRSKHESLDQHFSINFDAPFILTSQFARLCKKGQIINILDTHIVRNTTSHATYLLSKKALAELTKLSAVELAPDIRVNAVAPGLILPPADKRQGYLDRLAKRIPLKKKGSVDQITDCVNFLLENPYLTGQIIYNDGGEHLT